MRKDITVNDIISRFFECEQDNTIMLYNLDEEEILYDGELVHIPMEYMNELVHIIQCYYNRLELFIGKNTT